MAIDRIEPHRCSAEKDIVEINREYLEKGYPLGDTIHLSAYSVGERITHALLKLAVKLGEEIELGMLIQLPVSRSDLAEMLRTTTASASRGMSRFQKEGLIRSGRQRVAITDREGLIASGQRLAS